MVDKNAPYSTLREFIDYARANPGKISYSSGGPATNNHLSTAYLAGKEGLDMVHVPFGGGQAALTAVLSKSVDMHFGNSSDLIEPVKSGISSTPDLSGLEAHERIVGKSLDDFETMIFEARK